MPTPFDETDRLLLVALQQNARLSTVELAEMTGLSQSPCWRRIRRMEEAGLITGYRARLSRRELGHGVLAFVSFNLDLQNETRSAEFVEAVRAIPEVVMCHGITGPADFLLMVVAGDLDAYSRLLQEKLHRLPGVKQVQTSFSLQEFVGFDALPVPAREPDAAARRPRA